MNIWNYIRASDGHLYRFRRRHPADSFAGLKGVFVFLRTHDFVDPHVLYVRASNDLAEVDEPNLAKDSAYRKARSLGCNSVGVFLTGTASNAYRERVAKVIAEYHGPRLNEAA